MTYTSRENLIILELKDGSDVVSLEELARLIMERPSNMIYCENEFGGGQKLRGIISMGDIKRAALCGENSVCVNTKFTKLNGFEYMRARKIFRENDKINSLPIVDSDNRLIGDYSRWDDEISTFEIDNFRSVIYTDILKTNIKRAAFLDTDKIFLKKKELMGQFRQRFDEIGIKTEVVQRQELIEAIDRNDVVLFADEDELRGLGTLYRDIYEKYFDWNKIKTFGTIADDINAYNVIKGLQERGIVFITLQIIGNESSYWRNLNNSLKNKFSKIGKERIDELYKELWEEFFDEIYSYEYARKINSINFAMNKSKGIVKLNDAESELYNVKNGERFTVGQPKEYEKSIYFFGPCIITGNHAEDAHTIESYLQQLINNKGYNVRVVNYGSWQDEMALLQKICTYEYKKGDIVVVYDNGKCFDGIPNLNLVDCLERENVPAEWMIDTPWHCNYKINQIYAWEIFNFIEDKLKPSVTDGNDEKIDLSKDYIIQLYVERYFLDYTPNGTVGAIVMNCNPFTLGHQYLIEQALNIVDNLIVFVVEEDKSLFSFKERYAMVREGTKDLVHVKVAPSGNFILSQTTFPEYFIKIEDKDLDNNVENDLTIFAEFIAPRLNITYRFVGEEKADKVTDAYNKAMKRILPPYGINVIEIPRLIMADGSGEVVSATKVRERIETYPFGDLSDLVPESTEKLLVQLRESM